MRAWRARWGPVGAIAALLLAGCAGLRPGLDNGAVLGYEGLDRDIERFYRARAWEENATCTSPHIDRLLGASIVAETETEIVASIRYSWRDGGMRPHDCRGRDERRFTLEKIKNGVRIVAMTGPQRPPR